mmetsp:Transcript_2843/g.7008  ORF Transcript_2843/g.7008 Transcript_2843/m.7008 type:complete len:276 (-) Transcript_2843:1879-2706(-)
MAVKHASKSPQSAAGMPAAPHCCLSSASSPSGASSCISCSRIEASVSTSSAALPERVFSSASTADRTSALAGEANAFSHVPKGSATEEGILTKAGRDDALARTFWRLLLFPPRLAVVKSESTRTRAAVGAGALSPIFSGRATFLAAPAPSPEAPAETATSPVGNVLTVTSPVRALRALNCASSWHVASITPWLRARMAMWERMSVELRVRMAVTPGGMSSTPPILVTMSTWGVSKLLPWMPTMSSITLMVPAALLEEPVSSHAPRLAALRAIGSR